MDIGNPTIVGKSLYFFVQGFIVGAGPCLLLCAPIILPYIAGTQKDWRAGLRTTLIFSSARLLVYTLLGGLVGYVGSWLFLLFNHRFWGDVLWGGAGIFLILLGVLMILGLNYENPLCRLAKSGKSVFLLGVLVGLSPCLPLIAVLTEIMFISDHIYQGLFYGLAFGMGTVFSPLLILGALAAWLPGKFAKESTAGRLFNFLCGLSLCLFGLYLIIIKMNLGA
ncbi:MAG: sulfite exporter TauE/SafE family protein [Candidatus Margulisbacteria bacterium]|nr:sulfite exporter TauE/SafE family protein [Candidatus Margulisiibacteriota bacterium]